MTDNLDPEQKRRLVRLAQFKMARKSFEQDHREDDAGLDRGWFWSVAFTVGAIALVVVLFWVMAPA